MKVNDIVTVSDGSWSAEFKCGKLAAAAVDQSRKWRVLAVNCKLPSEGELYSRTDCPNDTIITPCNEPDRIVFTHSRFLKSPLGYCSQCGAELKER